ncbi:hypothetical protein LZD49_27855 [Dyadobacter sp. CY261]|uniref:hypothetical protein n=1 Tax=Dyadobacter sp. CY261 TaxID=2907203 RepID=UPI001F3E4C96|nr:hypothetical protein [Dyadobacter sp. CY261]MCF0074330.1 hypothetical protein [Dyadobacter sp. CY261]
MNLLVFVTLSVFVGSVSLFAAYLQSANPFKRTRPGYSIFGSVEFRDILLFFACITPAVIFFTVWAITTVNFPFQDDIDAILESTATIAEGPVSLREFWSAVSKQDDERRIVVVRLVACLVYWASGAVDFRVVAFAGICSYLVFLKLVLAWFRSERNPPLALFLPVPYLLFSNFNYAALYQAMVPLQHIGVYVWGFASIWLISRNTRVGVMCGFALGVLAIYSDVTGIFIGPVVALMLLASRRWVAATCCILLFASVTIFYFRGLAVPDFRPTLYQNLSSWRDMLLMAIAMPGMMADVLLEKSETSRLAYATIAGVASLSLVGSSTWQFGKKLLRGRHAITPGQWWLAGCILFLLITFIAFAFGRAAYGAHSILLSRYKHMFTFWAVFNYLLLLQLPAFRRLLSRHLLILQAGALVYFGASYFQTWGDMMYLRKTILIDAYGWTKNREFPSAPIYLAVKKTVDSIFENALKNRIYQFPDLPFEDLRQADVRGLSDIVVRTTDFIVVGVEAPVFRCAPDDGIYLIIHSNDEMHVLPMRMRRSSFLSFLRTGRYYGGYCESMGMLRQYLCKNKKYKLTLGVISGPNRYLLTTGKEVSGG